MPCYADIFATIFAGREFTREIATDEELELPPMVEEPNQAEIDAEQARQFREAAAAQRERNK